MNMSKGNCKQMSKEENINQYMKVRESHINSLKTIMECCGKRCRGGGCCQPGGPAICGPYNMQYSPAPPCFPGGGGGCGPCPPNPCGPCGPSSCGPYGPVPGGPCGPICCPQGGMPKPASPQPCFSLCGPPSCGPFGPGQCGPFGPVPCGPFGPVPCGPCDPRPYSPCGPCLPNSRCGPCGPPCLPLPPLCPPSHSANGIIEDSKRQMNDTEQEIREKLNEIRNKKDRLESDISELQKTLLDKHRLASANLQAARAAKAAEAAQAAQVAQAVQAAQAAQACEAARAAAALQEAQCEQTYKAAQAAKAAEIAQCAQANQAAQYAQAAQAAQIAEAAQVAQALQAEEAARAADTVKAAQANQAEQAEKAFQAAEQLRQAQAIQACKAAQAIEAIQAAHLSQVAQQSQACQAQCQAQTVLQCHKYHPNIACRQYPYCPGYYQIIKIARHNLPEYAGFSRYFSPQQPIGAIYAALSPIKVLSLQNTEQISDKLSSDSVLVGIYATSATPPNSVTSEEEQESISTVKQESISTEKQSITETYVTTSSHYGEPVISPVPSEKKNVNPNNFVMITDLHCNNNDVNSLKTTIKDMQHQIVSLNAEFDSYKNSGDPQRSKHPQDRPGASPVCLCGVTNLQEENVRLRHGLVAKHNEVVHLRGLMMDSDNFGKPTSGRYQQHTKSSAVQQMFLDPRLPAGGLCAPSCPQNGGIGTNGGGAGRSSYGRENGHGIKTACMMGYGAPPAQIHPGMGTQTSGGYGMGAGGVPCNVPGCPHGRRVENCSMGETGAYPKMMGSMAFCDTNQSATTIIVESKRQMEQTENEIKSKLQEIKGKKNELEEDITKLQEVLLAKQQEASTNMQAARAVRAAEIAQAAQMATELQKQQRAQALAAAKAAAHLQQAQDEQSRKQAMAAKAAEAAQQAQNHQLMMAAETVAAAERAEHAQNEQAVQAEEAARAAEAVQAAQEEQNQLANKQLQDAEELKRNQEEQACKTAQATEALHAAHVAQVAQQAQACQATAQAHTVLTQHKYIPPTMGCEELERGMHVNMSRANGKCCNPNCPNNK